PDIAGSTSLSVYKQGTYCVYSEALLAMRSSSSASSQFLHMRCDALMNSRLSPTRKKINS
ncbi:hypothetical protein PO909_005834, partial [Leuciscus waleckii]